YRDRVVRMVRELDSTARASRAIVEDRVLADRVVQVTRVTDDHAGGVIGNDVVRADRDPAGVEVDVDPEEVVGQRGHAVGADADHVVVDPGAARVEALDPDPAHHLGTVGPLAVIGDHVERQDVVGHPVLEMDPVQAVAELVGRPGIPGDVRADVVADRLVAVGRAAVGDLDPLAPVVRDHVALAGAGPADDVVGRAVVDVYAV